MLELTETHSVSRESALTEIRDDGNIDVRVIGVGGAGCSTLMRLQEFASPAISMLGIDTGSAAQNLPAAIESITIGNGFGSGGNPETALENFAEVELSVEDFVEEADVVIVLAGLGRGTGSGLSPHIAELARNSGALTIAAVNMPFEFEGRFRNQSAAQALSDLESTADAVITMNNDDLSKLSGAGASLNGSFQQADLNIANAVHAITVALESSQERAISVQHSLTRAGQSAVLSGTSAGLHAGGEAIERAFASTYNEFSRVNSAVVHVEGGIGLSLGQVAEVVTALRGRIGRRAEIHVSSERLVGMGQEINVTLVLAGVDYTKETDEDSARLTRIEERRPANPAVSIFDTPLPKRTRGPELLPTG